MCSDPFDVALVHMSPHLRAYFRRKVSDPSMAEDLAQETLLKALRARSTLRNHDRFQAWVFGIAHHTITDYYRRNSSAAAIGCEVICTEQPRVVEDVREILACSARCYLGTLPPMYRVPVHLAEYEGCSHEEVASRLGLSLPAVKSRVRRGKIMVRHLMEAQCEFDYDAFGKIVGYRVRAIPQTATIFK